MFDKLFDLIKSFVGEDLDIKLLKIDVHPDVVDEIEEELKNKKELKKILEERLREFNLEINKKPTVVLIFGPNGAGKTTTIWKLANIYKNVVIAAADTFRAGSIEQLKKLCKDFKVISRDYGASPSSVVRDAINHAKSKGIDLVLVDSAGRQENIYNLVEELKNLQKLVDYSIYVCESTSGKVSYEKIKKLLKYGIKIDGAIITKTDVDDKGGIILNLAYLNIPIWYICYGQNVGDIKKFEKEKFINEFSL